MQLPPPICSRLTLDLAMCLALVNGAIESVMDADVKVPELQRLSFLVALWKPLTAIYVKEARVACWRMTDHQVTN